MFGYKLDYQKSESESVNVLCFAYMPMLSLSLNIFQCKYWKHWEFPFIIGKKISGSLSLKEWENINKKHLFIYIKKLPSHLNPSIFSLIPHISTYFNLILTSWGRNYIISWHHFFPLFVAVQFVTLNWENANPSETKFSRPSSI